MSGVCGVCGASGMSGVSGVSGVSGEGAWQMRPGGYLEAASGCRHCTLPFTALPSLHTAPGHPCHLAVLSPQLND